RARQRQREGSAESDIGPTSRRVGCKIVPTPRGNDDGLTRLVILRCRDPAGESPWLAGSLLQVRSSAFDRRPRLIRTDAVPWESALPKPVIPDHRPLMHTSISGMLSG